MHKTTVGGWLLAGALTASASMVTNNAAWNGVLNAPDAWDGGAVPGTEDVAVFTNASASYSLGEALSWGGLQFSGGSLALTGDSLLTVGTNGITLTSDADLSLRVPLKAKGK